MAPFSFLSGLIHAPGRTILRGLVMLALLTVGGVAILMLLEVPFTPWARSFGMWPTLTGEWIGELETAEGRSLPVFLEMGGGFRGRSTYIDGRARLCYRRDAIREFKVAGRPDNYRGTKFHLSLRQNVEGDSGLVPGNLQGEWQGDEIRATSTLISLSPVGTASATAGSRAAEPPRARYALRRGSEQQFLAACAGKDSR